MDDKQIISILLTIVIVILGLISIGACLYAIPLCFIRRFHTPLHLLTLNVCIATFICSTFWAIYLILYVYFLNLLLTAQLCILFYYIQTVVNCQVLYASCIVSLNRLFAIIYKNKALFSTKKWVGICVSIQWIFAILIPLPLLASNSTNCLKSGLELFYRIYILIIVAVISSICLAITNSIIFIYAHRSSRRIQPKNENNAPIVALSRRDTYLLKHMIFMFVIFFCGWVPIYLIGAINWNGLTIPLTVFQGLRLLPATSLFIIIVDLFWYNRELRQYFINQQLNNRQTTHMN